MTTTNSMHRATEARRWVGWAAAFAVSLLACAKPPEPQTAAPLCHTLVGSNARQLFSQAVVPTAKVRESLIFGGMDPGTLEPINFELGFLLNDLNVPLTAPADLYVWSMESTHYITGGRAGETDYSISFHVCSDDATGELLPAVEGQFAHITTLAPDLKALFDSGTPQCTTNTGITETSEACSIYLPRDAEHGLVVTAGSSLGSGGGTGLTSYAPGFDFNLLDTRFPIAYVNPNRLGAEEGQGKWFRYGACVYEYFADPFKTAYLGKVGQNGMLRAASGDPCGRMAIDLAGTAAGVWILADKADLKIETQLVEVLQSLLVLAPHPVDVGAKEVVSSELTTVAVGPMGEGVLVEFAQQDTGDENVSFYAMTPGPIYCIDGIGFLNPVPQSYYLQLGPNGETLKIERLGATCHGIAQGSRAFTSAALNFVR